LRIKDDPGKYFKPAFSTRMSLVFFPNTCGSQTRHIVIEGKRDFSDQQVITSSPGKADKR
jgi:hypothetical protein